jgi:hypothetical protein
MPSAPITHILMPTVNFILNNLGFIPNHIMVSISMVGQFQFL